MCNKPYTVYYLDNSFFRSFDVSDSIFYKMREFSYNSIYINKNDILRILFNVYIRN